MKIDSRAGVGFQQEENRAEHVASGVPGLDEAERILGGIVWFLKMKQEL